MYIYRFKNKENRVIYVGKTKDIKSRIKNHSHLSKQCYDETVSVEFSKLKNKTDMDLYEVYYINKYEDLYNKSSNNELSSSFKLKSLEWVKYDEEIDFKSNQDTTHKLAYKFDPEIYETVKDNFDITEYEGVFKIIDVLSFLKYCCPKVITPHCKFELCEDNVEFINNNCYCYFIEGSFDGKFFIKITPDGESEITLCFYTKDAEYIYETILMYGEVSELEPDELFYVSMRYNRNDFYYVTEMIHTISIGNAKIFTIDVFSRASASRDGHQLFIRYERQGIDMRSDSFFERCARESENDYIKELLDNYS